MSVTVLSILSIAVIVLIAPILSLRALNCILSTFPRTLLAAAPYTIHPKFIHDLIKVLYIQPVLISLRINNTTLHFPIAYNAYAKVAFCMHMIRQSFPLNSVESRCVQTPRSIFSSRDVTSEAQFARFT